MIMGKMFSIECPEMAKECRTGEEKYNPARFDELPQLEIKAIVLDGIGDNNG
jgi:hypothetical protein